MILIQSAVIVYADVQDVLHCNSSQPNCSWKPFGIFSCYVSNYQCIFLFVYAKEHAHTQFLL